MFGAIALDQDGRYLRDDRGAAVDGGSPAGGRLPAAAAGAPTPRRAPDELRGLDELMAGLRFMAHERFPPAGYVDLRPTSRSVAGGRHQAARDALPANRVREQPRGASERCAKPDDRASVAALGRTRSHAARHADARAGGLACPRRRLLIDREAVATAVVTHAPTTRSRAPRSSLPEEGAVTASARRRRREDLRVGGPFRLGDQVSSSGRADPPRQVRVEVDVVWVVWDQARVGSDLHAVRGGAV